MHPKELTMAKRNLVPLEVEASYAKIIDSILANSDLDTISEKRIRKGLQESVEYDITPQKVRSSCTYLVQVTYNRMSFRRP